MSYSRRNFIQTTSAASSALLLGGLDVLAEKIPTTSMHKNFELKVLATDWGYKGGIDQYCAHVRKEGYDGIEIWWPLDKQKQDDLFAALKKNQLEVGFLVAGDQPDFKDHLDHFKTMIGAAVRNKEQRPLYINCHSGRDFFSFEQNQVIIDHTLSLATETGILILHETHRSRMCF